MQRNETVRYPPRPSDGHEVTMTASSRNSSNYQWFLQLIEKANPTSAIVMVADNLSSHNSKSTRHWTRGSTASTSTVAIQPETAR